MSDGTTQVTELLSAHAERSDDPSTALVLESFNPEQFVTVDGTVDNAKVDRVLTGLGIRKAEPPRWPATGQGRRGSRPQAENDGLTEARHRFGSGEDE